MAEDSRELDVSTIELTKRQMILEGPPLLGLTILAHPDSSRVGERTHLSDLSSGREVSISRKEPLFATPRVYEPRPLSDPHMSRRGLRLLPEPEGNLRLERGDVRAPIEIEGTELEQRRYITAEELVQGLTLVTGRVALLLHVLKPTVTTKESDYGLVGDSAAITEIRLKIRRMARYSFPVLLRGETGTGKELVARAIHDASPQGDRPWIAINMGAIPPSLAAAELFGAVRGAYTGATNKRAGYFQRADRGTLFLDEIGETPVEVQALLLRAVETGEVQPVGANEPIHVKVRLIAATDANLENAISEGQFRAPLLHRLGAFEILLPPLRERRDDIGRLLIHFLRQELESIDELGRLAPAGAHERPWLPASLVARLARYDWPGNVRQLRNVARQLVIAGDDVSESELERWIDSSLGTSSDSPARSETEGVEASHLVEAPEPQPHSQPRSRSYRQPHEVSDEELIASLSQHRWRLKPAAEALGVSRTSLYALIDRCPEIRRATELSREEIEACQKRHGGDFDAMAEELRVSRHGLLHQMRELALNRSDV